MQPSNVQVRNGSSSSFLEKISDRAVICIIVALVVVAPLAGGSARRGAYISIEILVSGLIFVWMTKLALLGFRRQSADIGRIAVPGGLLIALLLFQVTPLPPAIIRAISPSTYRIYVETLPGWPDESPYRQLLGGERSSREPAKSLERAGGDGRFRTIAISTPITRIGLFKLLCCAVLFALVVLYDFATFSRKEAGLYRALFFALICSGLAVSVFAITGTPYSAHSMDVASVPRATGPYQNPDHLAFLLTMIFPLAVVGLLFPTSVADGRSKVLLRILSGLSGLAMSIALLLTISRSAWMGIGLATIILLTRPSQLFARFSAVGLDKPLVRAAVAISIALGLFVVVGSEAQTGVYSRAVQTFTTVDERIGVWKDSLPMVRDFPVLGVGFGCWSEIFPHYQSPPWLNTAYWEATHNDYFEVLTEIGAAGLAILAWLLVVLGATLRRGMRTVSADRLPIVVAVVAGAVAVLFEEFFDFGLQVPSNAVVFVVILGLGIRLSLTSTESTISDRVAVTRAWPILIGTASLAIALLSLTQLQDRFGEVRTSPADARRGILADPASPDEHLLLVEMANNGLSDYAVERELKVILWLQPTNPYVRDLYARLLLRRGQRAESLSQIRTSVMFAPEIATHRFLGDINTLTEGEKKAVEEGFLAAEDRGYPNAVDELSYFYRISGDVRKAADNYDASAKRAHSGSLKSAFLARAGDAYAAANEMERADAELRDALKADAGNIEANEDMLRLLVKAGADDRAESVIRSAAENGTALFPLYLTLARAERSAGRFELAERFASDALAIRRYDRDALILLGEIYLAEHKPAQANSTFERATDVASDSGEAFYYLATSRELQYDYTGAEQAFRRAATLSPKDDRIQSAYQEFERKLKKR